MSDAVTGYAVSSDGSVALLNPDGVAAATGDGTNPIDMALAGSILYVHPSGPNGRSIVSYRITPTGAFVQVTKVNGLPAGAQGIAAR